MRRHSALGSIAPAAGRRREALARERCSYADGCSLVLKSAYTGVFDATLLCSRQLALHTCGPLFSHHARASLQRFRTPPWLGGPYG